MYIIITTIKFYSFLTDLNIKLNFILIKYNILTIIKLFNSLHYAKYLLNIKWTKQYYYEFFYYDSFIMHIFTIIIVIIY